MIREQIQTSPQYQQLSAQADEATDRSAETVGDALAPVLSWSKGDVEFWTQVAQLVVLLLILREMRGGTL